MQHGSGAAHFAEFRRRVQRSELIATGILQLLRAIRFSGRLSIVVHNGEILQSGYEEGYFTRGDDRRII